MATMKELKEALVAAHNAGNKEHAAKLADAIRNAEKVTPRSEQELQKEYDASPWYSQLGQSADDMVRLAASGISFGQLDKWLGPEEAKKTAEARTRAGLAGDVAEIGGSVMSPVTQGVSVLGNVAARAAPGLLSRMGIAGAEGRAVARHWRRHCQAAALCTQHGDDCALHLLASISAHIGEESAARLRAWHDSMLTRSGAST
jgi:hypothetical protein